MNDRQKQILEIIKKDGSVSVSKLSKTLYVAEMTIRRDLSQMEKDGFLHRYRGGAVVKINTGEMPITERLLLDKEEKEALAKKCLPYLRDDISVFIDSSSTCHYILNLLSAFKNVTVVTNSASALITLGKLHIPCIFIGGEYYEQDMCTVGSLSENFAKNINVDVAFFTTAGISQTGVISDFDVKQTMIRKIIMQNSKKNVFIFEKGKVGKVFLYTLCNKSEVDAVITSD